jgi:hypothetical protein
MARAELRTLGGGALLGDPLRFGACSPPPVVVLAASLIVSRRVVAPALLVGTDGLDTPTGRRGPAWVPASSPPPCSA